MSAPFPPDPGGSVPPEPAAYNAKIIPDMQSAGPGTRVAGFLLGAGAGLVAGVAFPFLGGFVANTLEPSKNGWLGIVVAGPVHLAVAILVGRWLWKAKHMKGTAVGLIVSAALWCAFDVTCGVLLKDFRV